MHRARLLPRLVCLAVVGGLLLTLTVLLARPVAAASSTENALALKINAARASAGLPPLRVTADLTSYARSHSAAMMQAGQLFHTSSWSAICCWKGLDENVGTGGSVSVVHAMFMASSGHRANILDPAMRQVGVGVVRAGNGQLWVTEVFRNPTAGAPAGWLPTGATVTATPAVPRPRASSPRAAVRASRSAVHVDPVLAALARLSAQAARRPAPRDPIAQAVGWSAAMRSLVPSG